LAGRICVGLELVDQLIELVEVDAGPEPERVGNSFHDLQLPRPRLLAEPGSQRAIDHILEWEPKLAGSSP
jgi:hypothetical protein